MLRLAVLLLGGLFAIARRVSLPWSAHLQGRA